MNLRTIMFLVSASRKSQRAADDIAKLTGGKETVLDDIHGDCVDALISASGEKADELSDTMTYKLLQDESLTDKQVAEMLLNTAT